MGSFGEILLEASVTEDSANNNSRRNNNLLSLTEAVKTQVHKNKQQKQNPTQPHYSTRTWRTTTRRRKNLISYLQLSSPFILNFLRPSGKKKLSSYLNCHLCPFSPPSGNSEIKKKKNNKWNWKKPKKYY